MILGNLIGLLALGAIPLLVLIYFLRRRPAAVSTSLLFLLNSGIRQASAGRRFQRWHSSLPFWLLLLVFLLLSFLLLSPRFIVELSSRRVAIILDTSFSMAAFREETAAALQELTAKLSAEIRDPQYLLMSSDSAEPLLYSGSDVAALLQAYEEWQPGRGLHDARRSFSHARLGVGEDGLVIWMTDTVPEEKPEDVVLIALGSPVDNVGFGGATVTSSGDRQMLNALVINHSDSAQERSWQIESAGAVATPQRLVLAPRESRELAVPFPENGYVTLKLESDRFPLDDILPAVLPVTPALAVRSLWDGEPGIALEPLFEAMPTLQPASALADLQIGWADAAAPGMAAVTFDRWSEQAAGIWTGITVVGNHPLVQGLDWSSLVLRRPPEAIAPPEGDILVWRDGVPLLTLLTTGSGPRLHFSFDPRHGNLDRLPSFVILMSRFADDLLLRKAVDVSRNFDLGQVLPHGLSAQAAGNGRNASATARVPLVPGFFTIVGESGLTIAGAAQFADLREADFRQAASTNELPDRIQVVRNREATKLSWLETVLLMGALIALCAAWMGERGRVLSE